MGMLATLFVKKEAQEIAKAAVEEGIKAALATFKNEILEHFDRTYVRTSECLLKMESQDDRIDVQDLGLRELEKRFNNHTFKKAN
jgi:hypothetical protein